MLEYCSPVWSPVTVTLINQLESVQRRFTKRLPGFQTLPYDERCAFYWDSTGVWSFVDYVQT